jgi:hypothetical protein
MAGSRGGKTGARPSVSASNINYHRYLIVADADMISAVLFTLTFLHPAR